MAEKSNGKTTIPPSFRAKITLYFLLFFWCRLTLILSFKCSHYDFLLFTIASTSGVQVANLKIDEQNVQNFGSSSRFFSPKLLWTFILWMEEAELLMLANGLMRHIENKRSFWNTCIYIVNIKKVSAINPYLSSVGSDQTFPHLYSEGYYCGVGYRQIYLIFCSERLVNINQGFWQGIQIPEAT